MKGYRTIVFNVLMALIMALSQFGVFGADTPAPTEAEVGAALDGLETSITAIWGIGNLILRAITNTPMFKPSA